MGITKKAERIRQIKELRQREDRARDTLSRIRDLHDPKRRGIERMLGDIAKRRKQLERENGTGAQEASEA